MKRTLGCFVRGIVALVLLGIIAAVAVSFLGGDKEKHTLIGEILVFPEDGFTTSGENCTAAFGDWLLIGGETIYVEDGTLDGTEATLADGIITPEGNCSFEFIVDVQSTDLYAFTVNGLAVVRQDRTIGKEIPDGYRHSNAENGDWWVSMWGSDFE